MIHGIVITPGLLAMWICVLMGALVLNQFTRLNGVMGFTLNAGLLFGGALLANRLTAGMSLPLASLMDRTLLVSFGGMLASSLLILVVFSGRWKS